MNEKVVFISYSRHDDFGQVIRQKLEVLLRHTLERYGVRLFVDDTLLRAGDTVTAEVLRHIDQAVVGVLLVNPAFYASNYIREVEYPALTRRAEQGLSRLVPVLVEECLWQHDPGLSKILFANDAAVPLIELREDPARLSRALSRIARMVVEHAIDVGAAIPTPDPLVPARLTPRPVVYEGDIRRQGELHGVPPLPRVVLDRPAEVNQIRSAVLSSRGGVRALGLFGDAGIGKTVLATIVARDEAVRASFPDGVYWLTVGEAADSVQAQTALCALFGDTPVFRNRRDGRARLLELLRDMSCLVVIDDVWAGDQLQALLATGPAGATLVTTRKQFVLEVAEVPAYRIESLTLPESRELLTAAAGFSAAEARPTDIERIVTATGGVALAVTLVGSAMRHGRAGAEVVAHLETDDFGDHPYANAFKAMTLATATLDEAQLQRYRALAVFPPDAAIPVVVIRHWWRHLDDLDADQTRAELRTLASLELIELADDTTAEVRLHDLKHDFLLYDVSDPLPMLHGELVDSFLAPLPHGTWGELSVDEPYLMKWIVHHTRAAGRLVAPFVTDVAYIVKRLWVSGSRAAEADLLTAAGEEHRQSARADQLARLVGSVGHLLAGLPSVAFTAMTFRLWMSNVLGEVDVASLTPLMPPLGLVPLLPAPGVTKAQLRVLEGHRDWVLAVDYSPDGKHIATGSADHTVRIWRSDTGEQNRVLSGRSPVQALAFSVDGRHLVIALSNGSVDVWDWENLHQVGGLPQWPRPARKVVAQHGDGLVAAAGEDGVRLFALGESGVVRVVAELAEPAWAVAFAPDRDMFATAGEDGVRLFALGETGVVRVVAALPGPAWAVAFSADGDYVASTGEDGAVKVVNARSAVQLSVLRGHTDWVRTVMFSPTGGQLATGSDDGTARVWDALAASRLGHDRAHDDWVRSVSFSPDGQFLATASDDGTARLWQAATGEQNMLLAGHKGRVLSVVFTPDGQRVTTTCSDGLVRTWSIETGELLATYRGHADWIRDTSFSSDGKYLATASDDGTARLWDAATGAEVLVLSHRATRVRAVAFVPNTDQVVTAGTEGVARIWDTASGETTGVLTGHTGGVRHVRISPDGTLAATAGEDGTVRLYHLSSTEQISVFDGHNGRVRGVAFDADGGLVAAGDSGGILRVWATSGELLAAVRLARSLRAVAFSPQGRSIAVGGDNAWFLFRLSG